VERLHATIRQRDELAATVITILTAQLAEARKIGAEYFHVMTEAANARDEAQGQIAQLRAYIGKHDWQDPGSFGAEERNRLLLETAPQQAAPHE